MVRFVEEGFVHDRKLGHLRKTFISKVRIRKKRECHESVFHRTDRMPLGERGGFIDDRELGDLRKKLISKVRIH